MCCVFILGLTTTTSEMHAQFLRRNVFFCNVIKLLPFFCFIPNSSFISLMFMYNTTLHKCMFSDCPVCFFVLLLILTFFFSRVSTCFKCCSLFDRKLPCIFVLCLETLPLRERQKYNCFNFISVIDYFLFE